MNRDALLINILNGIVIVQYHSLCRQWAPRICNGFALKKVSKWMLIIVDFLAGMFFVGVQLLQEYGYRRTVNWDYPP